MCFGKTDSEREGCTSSDDECSTNSSSNSSECDSTEEESSDVRDVNDEEGAFQNANKPLYVDAPLTVAESILSIFTLSARFPIPGALLAAILELIEGHCKKPNIAQKLCIDLKNVFLL